MLFNSSKGDIVFLEEYLLTEAIKPKVTKFGTDLEGENESYIKSGNVVYTFFKDKNFSYLVAVDIEKGEIAFASKEGTGRERSTK